MKEKFTIIADPRVKEDLKEARDFLNTRRKGFGTKFINEFRDFLNNLQTNPMFQIRYKEVHCLPMKTFKYMIKLTIKLNKYIFTQYFPHIKIQINTGYNIKSNF